MGGGILNLNMRIRGVPSWEACAYPLLVVLRSPALSGCCRPGLNERGAHGESFCRGEFSLAFVERVEDVGPEQQRRSHMDDVQAARADFGGVPSREPSGKHKDLVRKPLDSENAIAQVMDKLFKHATRLGGGPLFVEYTELNSVSELQLDERCKNEDWPVRSHFCERSRGMRVAAVKRNEETGVSVSVQ